MPEWEWYRCELCRSTFQVWPWLPIRRCKDATHLKVHTLPAASCLGCHVDGCPLPTDPPAHPRPTGAPVYRKKSVVSCSVEEIDLDSDDDRDRRPVPSVQVTCGRCGHEESSYGTSGGSVLRCLVLLRGNCPENERNWYEIDVDDLADHDR
jgi:hypothetical protein